MQKRDGSIKAQAFADGCKQKVYTGKIDAASSTAMTESIFTTTVIKARKKEM